MDKSAAQNIAKVVVKEAADIALSMESPSVETEVERILYQDPPWKSWRLWGSFWTVVTAILAVPEVQAALIPLIGSVLPPALVPLVTAVLGAAWPIISKLRDPREVRP